MAFRICIGVLTAVLLAGALFTFYNFAGSPTDENLFSDLPGHLAFRATVPALVGTWQPLSTIGRSEAGKFTDTVRTGDLLVLLNGRGVPSLDRLRAIRLSLTADSMVSLYLIRPYPRLGSMIRVSGTAISESLFTDVPKGALVVSVTPGGASDRAGMRVGDIIVRINGETFTGAEDGDVLLRRAQSGHVIVYDVLRDLAPMALPVTLARFGFPLSLLILSLSGLAFMGVGAFVGLQRPRLRAAQLISLGGVSLGFALAIIGIRREPDLSVVIVARWIAMVLSLFFGLAFTWHGSLMFPTENKVALQKRWLVRLEYLLAGALSALMIVLGAQGTVRGFPEVLLLGSGLLVLGLYGTAFRFAMRRGLDAAARERRRIMKLTGYGVGIINTLLFIALIFTNNFDQWGFVGVPLLLLPLAMLYTIGRYRLLGMNLRIKRTIQYVLTSVLWAVVVLSAGLTLLTYALSLPLRFPLVTIHGLSIEVNDASLLPGQSNEMERLIFVCIGLLAWVVVATVRRLGQGEIDRRFDRTQYDYRRALAEVSAVLSTNLSMTGLGKGIVAKLVDLMKLRRAAVFFFKDEKICCCREAQGEGMENWGEFCRSKETLLAAAVGQATGPLASDGLPAELRDECGKYQFEHIIPVRSKDRLIAVLVLGEKLSEAPYTAEDIDFLSSVALQASVAIENAFLYEELAEQERLKRELEIARRIQLASLPQVTPAVPGLDIAGRSLPALEVGGDFFDYLPGGDGSMTIIVGDVSGKGTSAALYMSKMQGVLRSLHTFVDSPLDLFLRANSLLAQGMEKSSYVTAIGGKFDAKAQTVSVARAGHLPLWHFDASTGRTEKLVPRGLGLALDQTEKFATELEQRSFPCRANDVFVFVSDGITEAMNAQGEEYGNDRLDQVIASNSRAGAENLKDAIFASVHAFAGSAVQHDDQTVVVVKIGSLP